MRSNTSPYRRMRHQLRVSSRTYAGEYPISRARAGGGSDNMRHRWHVPRARPLLHIPLLLFLLLCCAR
eukprot:3889912-Rhodomonas_salina.1